MPEAQPLLKLKSGWHRPLLLVHAGASIVALLAGPWQFPAGFRARHPRRHRQLGYAYLLGVVLGGLSGGFVATGSMGGMVTHVGFGLLSLLWLASAFLAWQRIVRGDVNGHQEWMLRNFALTFAAVTLRLWWPLLQALGVSFIESYQTVAWLSWVPNLIAIEIVLQCGRRPQALA